MTKVKLLNIRLNLFDGAAGAAAGSAGEGAGNGEAAQSETQATALPTLRAKKTGAYDNVKFGKQDAAESSDTATETESKSSPVTEEKPQRKSFKELIEGEYKDDYTKATQDMINRRFKDSKAQKAQMDSMQEVIDLIQSKYKTDDLAALKTAIESDNSMWESAADEAGMSVEQFKQFQKLQRENSVLQKQRAEQQRQAEAQAQISKWEAEAEGLRNIFPDFDLRTELNNPAFAGLISNRQYPVSMEAAYRAVHGNELMQQAITKTAAAAEKAVTDNVRARGNRPVENGASSQSSFTIKDDVSKLTRKDRQEIANRVKRGEIISY